jgi:hypothetical protein
VLWVMIGFVLGTTVGCWLGSALGCLDGSLLGILDGNLECADGPIDNIDKLAEGVLLGAWGVFVGDSARPSDGTGVRAAVGRSVSAGGFTAGDFKGTALEGKELGITREFVGFMVGPVVVCIKLGMALCPFDG